jgi:homopolymeric O-antigen transport system permease protein
MQSASIPLTKITARPPGFDLHLSELVEYRELIAFLVWRDIKVRYKQTTLGVMWAWLQPVLTMIVFTVVFGRLARLPSDGLPYPVFTLAALLPWQMFSSAVSGSANSLVGSGGLITKVYFPRLIVPLAAVLATLVDFVVSFVVLLALMAYYRISPTVYVVYLPLFIVLALAASLAAGLWFSALNVQYRDVQYVLPFVMQVWLLASPVGYSVSLIKSPLAKVAFGLNPMTGVIQGFRWALLNGSPPGWLLLPSVIIVGLLLAGGLLFFKRMEQSFADVI